MPQRSAQSTVDLTAGAGSRYVAQYASVMGTDMTQLEASGYKLVQGRMPKRAGEVLLGKYAAYQFMDKYRSDDDSRRIAPGDYECDENGCKESEGEKPFFDVLTTKLNLITGADYQSPDDYRKIGSTSMSSTDSGDGDGTASSQNPVVSMPLTVVGVLDASTNNYDAFSSGVVMSLEDMDTLQAKWWCTLKISRMCRVSKRRSKCLATKPRPSNRPARRLKSRVVASSSHWEALARCHSWWRPSASPTP